jgi:hypothetical protein
LRQQLAAAEAAGMFVVLMSCSSAAFISCMCGACKLMCCKLTLRQR